MPQWGMRNNIQVHIYMRAHSSFIVFLVWLMTLGQRDVAWRELVVQLSTRLEQTTEFAATFNRAALAGNPVFSVAHYCLDGAACATSATSASHSSLFIFVKKTSVSELWKGANVPGCRCHRTGRLGGRNLAVFIITVPAGNIPVLVFWFYQRSQRTSS